MKFKNTNTNSGFTIVELLIVIVVIGILAAITFVAFNGITARTNTSASKAAAASVVKKAEAYNAEKGNYPVQTSDLTGAGQNESFYIASNQITFAPANPFAKPSDNKTVRYLKCSATTPSPNNSSTNNQSLITAQFVSGVRVQYWDHQANAAASLDSGNTTNCPLDVS